MVLMNNEELEEWVERILGSAEKEEEITEEIVEEIALDDV